MRIRLTQNLDKERGFVNGAVGTIVTMLSPCNFILKTDRGIMLIVHPIARDGQVFMPCSYGYAMTIRRAQGSTLPLVVLCFDQKTYPADCGYAYVGASRVRRGADLFYFGRMRTSDWTPCGLEKLDRSWESQSRGSDSELDDTEEEYLRNNEDSDEDLLALLDDGWGDDAEEGSNGSSDAEDKHRREDEEEYRRDCEGSDEDVLGLLDTESVDGYDDARVLFE